MSNLVISNFQAVSLGDGKNVTLSWAVPDLSQVKYFVVECWDNNRKTWKPYDGFHGTIFPKTSEQFPPQKVSFTVSKPGDNSFRVKAVSHQGVSSEWANTSCAVTIEGSQYAETSYYFIKSGFNVTHNFGYNIKVESGVAYLGGQRVFAPSEISLRLPDKNNQQYVVYITTNGVVNFVVGNTTPPASIRLADIFVSPAGQISIIDQRFLWAPSGASILFDPEELGRLSYFISWEPYSEINLKNWRIYRAEGFEQPADDAFKAIATIEKDNASYEDTHGLKRGSRYWYRIGAVDWGDNESDLSIPFSIEFSEDDLTKPSTPSGLAAEAIGTTLRVSIELSWNANPEETISGYRLWYRPDEKENFILLASVDGDTTTYTHIGATKGKRYWYTLSAINTYYVESERCAPISCVAGDAIPPKTPQWYLVPLRTGATNEGEQSCWVELRWLEVTQNKDGSPIDDLTAYYVYVVESSGMKRFVGQVPAGVTSFRLNGLTRNVEYRFVITAVDKWGNESDYSLEQSIVAGGPVPKAPVLQTVETLDNPKVKVAFSAVAENTEDSGGGAATVTEYVIYRALNAPMNFVEVGRVRAQDPQPEDYSFIDSTSVRGDTYWYGVKAVNSGFNYSEMSNTKEVKAGDFTPPSAPVWGNLITRINTDFTIDNILTFSCGQEVDLHGAYIYARRTSAAEGWDLVGMVSVQTENPYSFTHANLTNGETYEYRLVAFDLVGNQSFSSEVQSIQSGKTTPPPAPEAVASGEFDYTLLHACVKLSWPEVVDQALMGYRIYRSLDADYDYELIATINSTNEATPPTYDYYDRNLINGLTYYYRVIAFDAFGLESGPCQIGVVAGDATVPAIPNVAVTPIFNPASPSLVTIELHITSTDVPGSYRIYRSLDGVKWFFDGEVDYQDEETIYAYEMVYGNTAYYRVSAVSVPGVESPYFEGERIVLDTVPPANIPAPNVSFEQTADGNFTAIVSWAYTAPEDFSRYEILFDQENPAVIATITEKNVKVYRVNGLKPGLGYSFAVACVDVYGLRSSPVWRTASPVDSSIPKAPASVTATGGILLILVEWEAVTHNTDNGICNDLASYIIEASKDEGFTDVKTITVPALSTSYTFNTSEISATWYFRVKAKDYYNNESDWTISNGAQAFSVSDQIEDNPPEEAPVWSVVQPDPATGVEWRRDNNGNIINDDPENVWIRFTWDVVENADHYNVYLSTDNISFYLVGQPKGLEYRIDGLLTNTTYYVKVAGAGLLGGEGPASVAKVITTAKAIRVIPAVTGLTVTEGKGMIALQWDPSPIKNVDYALECRATLNPPGDIRIFDPEWTEIYRGKTTTFVHPSLEYDKFYQYRVRCVDSSGNISDYGPADYDTFDWTPDQLGSEDLAANAIYARHIYSDQITAVHISAQSIESRHLTADSVTAGKIAAGAVSTRELNISVGGYNSILNSAFGMTNLDESYGTSWKIDSTCIECSSSDLSFNKYGEVVCNACGEVQTGFEITNTPGIPINSEYCLFIERGAPYYPNREIFQTLDLSHLSGKQAILSFFVKSDSVMDENCCIELLINYEENGSLKVRSEKITIKNTAEWNRRKVAFTAPENIISAALHIYMKGFSIGAIWLTGLQLEEGDVISPWNPNQNETYGCSGLVQINTDGIKVLNGKISVITDNGTVSITGSGIAAKRDDNNYALLNHAGLSVYSSGNEGALNIVSLNDQNSMEIRASGIVTRRQGVETFNLDTASATLSIFGGYLKFASNDDPTNPTYLEISSAGIVAKKNGATTLQFDNTQSKLSIFDGSFELRTSLAGLAQGIVFTKSGIKAYSPDKVTFELNAATGDIKIRNGSIFLGEEDNAGARMVLDQAGLRLYDESSIDDQNGLVLRISRTPIDGAVFFIDGSVGNFKIGSKGASVNITHEGIFGPSFSLDDSGLNILNGVIRNGDILINSDGISVFGGFGIKVYSANPTENPAAVLISTVDNNGITIQAERGLKIVGNGQISFHNPEVPDQFLTAISSTGINASAVTAGVLRITGDNTTEQPRIEVLDDDTVRANIDKSGISIYDGSLNVYSKDGGVAMIQDGYVLADGLQVGIGASSFIHNGRADFALEYWDFVGFLDVRETITERNIKAGRSGKYAFRLETPSGGFLTQEKLSTETYKEKKGTIYTFTAWVYLVNGEISVTIYQNNPDPIIINGSSKNTQITQPGWHRVKIRFSPTEESGGETLPVYYKFAAAAGTVAYITDVCAVEGDYSANYTCHPTELASADGSVQISDKGVAIKNGLFSLHSTEDGTAFEITGKGIYQYQEHGGNKDTNYNFKLDTTGFGLKLQNSNLVINNEDGLKLTDATDQNNYVQLTTSGEKKGLIIKGGLVDISSAGDNGPRLVIKNNKISVYDEASAEAVCLGLVEDNDSRALYGLVVKDGAVDICSGKLAEGGLRIKGNQITVRDELGTEVVQLGYVDMDDMNLYGLMIKGGRFALTSGEGEGYINIDSSRIRITHENIDEQGNTVVSYTELAHDGVHYYVDGQEQQKNEYVRHIQTSSAPVPVGQPVALYGFAKTPKILISPSSFMTYCSDSTYASKTQSIRFNVTNASMTSFIPTATYLVDSVLMTKLDKTLPSPKVGNRGSWEQWIGSTYSSSATQLTVDVYYFITSAGQYNSSTKLTYAVEFSYDDGKTWSQAAYKSKSGGRSGTEQYTSQVVTPRKIYVKIRANYNDPGGGDPAYVRLTSAFYYADEAIPVGGDVPTPYVNYIAIE